MARPRRSNYYRRRFVLRLPSSMVRDYKKSVQYVNEALEDFSGAENGFIDKAKEDLELEVKNIDDPDKNVDARHAIWAAKCIVEGLAQRLTMEREEMICKISWILADLEVSLFAA